MGELNRSSANRVLHSTITREIRRSIYLETEPRPSRITRPFRTRADLSDCNFLRIAGNSLERRQRYSNRLHHPCMPHKSHESL